MLNEITQTFDEITQKRAALQAELDHIDLEEKAAKAQMRADATAQIQALLTYFSIAPDELKFTRKRALVPRFRNPETGETWHGIGRRPVWLKDKEIRDYRITPSPKSEKKYKSSKKKQGQQATTLPSNEQGQAGNASAATTAINSTTLNADSEAATTSSIATNDYRHHQIYFSLFDENGSALLERHSWEEIIHILLIESTGLDTEAGWFKGFSGWHFQPKSDEITDKIDVSASAQLIPTSMSILVIDFYGSGPLSYFDDLQYVCYQFTDPHQPKVVKHRMVFPMLTKMPLNDYAILQPTIQEWADRHSIGKSDPASYEIGRVCSFPRACAEELGEAHTFYNPGGYMLHWPEFDDMRRTGEDMMLL